MTIENTRDRDPMHHMIGMMSGGSSGYIEGMEAAGARQVLTSDQIPTAAPWAELIELGFVKGESVSGDDLFTHVTLPEGWSRAGTGHSMHTDILDERGVPRVGIFYKAAFYDRRADAHLIYVPGKLATHLLYGDEPVALPDLWPVLTDDERQGFVTEMRNSITEARRNIAEMPDLDRDGRYTARIERAEAVLKLIPSAAHASQSSQTPA